MTESNVYHLDAVAGAQLALTVAIKLLLTSYRGNSEAIEALNSELEKLRALLLSSSASDYKIHSFNETAEALLGALQSTSGQ